MLGLGVRLPLIGAGMLVRAINTASTPLHRNKVQAYRSLCLPLRFSLLLITFLTVGMWRAPTRATLLASLTPLLRVGGRGGAATRPRLLKLCSFLLG